jgi:RNA polymerase sigma factor (sigma-70 family)
MAAGSYFKGTRKSDFEGASMSSPTLQMGVQRLRCLLAGQDRQDESDEELLRAFTTRRDDNAFAVLVRRHGPMVLRVCRRVLGHEQDAEDAFQATFLVLARKAAALRNKMALAGFLHGTAYRAALKAKLSAARRGKHEGRAPARASVNPAEEISWREVRELLDEEIARLPEKYRTVFVLCCLENLSQAEAARRLSIKERTLSSQLEVARRRLGKRLARLGVELTAVLAVAAWATPPASAVPAALMTRTIQAGLATATGEGPAGIVSSAVAELVQNATSGMMVSKTKMATVLLAAMLLAGAGAWTCITLAPYHPSPLHAAKTVTASFTTPIQQAETPQKPAADGITVNGRVLDPDGKPVKQANLFLSHLMKDGASPRLKLVGTTDDQGRFRISFRSPDKDVPNYLLAHAAGFGVDWVRQSEGERQAEVTLRLPKDVPITGRIINTEGRPVAGASVSITEIYVPANEKLDDYLKGRPFDFFDRLNNRTPKQLRVPLEGIIGKATTDKGGRFRIRGAGAERIVLVMISGGGVVRSTLRVITRPGFDAKPHNAAVRKYHEGREPIWLEIARNQFLYPPALEFVADAGNTIEGTVKDAASSKPIPGCRVSAWRWGEGLNNDAVSVSGARGEYRLEGLSKNDMVFVNPPKGSLYLSRRVEVASTARQPKVERVIELAKGALVIGRVVDRQTGKGVQGNVRFEPLAGNRFYGSKPGFEQRGYDSEETDKDGRFRRVTIPGKSLILFRLDHHHTEKLYGQELCVYRGAAPDPDHKDIFEPVDPKRWPDRWYVRRADGNVEQIPGVNNAVKVIDAKEDGETRIELFVDRGLTAQIVLQDADGKPLGGAWAGGLTDYFPFTYKLPEATATVYALNPDKPREMAFFHAEKQLGGTATVRGDEKGPVVVKLSPLGQVFGRVLNADGKPLNGVEVSLQAQTKNGGELDRVAAPRGKPVRADKDGSFHIEGVVPGLKFLLFLQAKSPIFDGFTGAAVRQVQVKPGEKLNLGDERVVVKPGP